MAVLTRRRPRAETETGMSRLALSTADKHARDWFVETTRSLGCKVTVDAMGNTFAVRSGKNKDAPPTCAGSHLDTQPSGGRYDGILGVCAGVEMLKVLHEEKIETEFPAGVINWTNEEGARFPMSMVSSGVWAGKIPLGKAHNLMEVGGGTRTMKQELERIGYLGNVDASYKAMPIGAHFELHIEQGPILENASQRIGIVQGVQAYKWYTITVRGRDCHTGTTPMEARSDALLTAARLILCSHDITRSKDYTVASQWKESPSQPSFGKARVSTGILTLSPGSVNTVPGLVKFSLDIRHPETEIVEELEKIMREAFAEVARKKYWEGEWTCIERIPGDNGAPCEVEWNVDFESQATKFHPDCIRCVEDASRDLFGDRVEELTRPLTSGAGHDSVFTSHRCPTSMIFVPCRRGVSHNPEEYCSPEDCATGAQVLMGSVLRFDELRGRSG